jgi:hypothetical protein
LFAGLIFLILADVFYELDLQLFADLVIKLGDDVLLFSFALLLISGIIFLSRQIGTAINAYFSAKERAKRRLFFSIAKNNYVQRLFNAKKKQLLYFSNLKRQRLLDKNNKKQSALLAKSIFKELTAAKHFLSETQFKHYSQAIKQALSEQNIKRLLELQHEISTFDSLIN